eukprot:GEMP01002038.1.p1 GENE.GEMP01002038.1~~GEMP01002038.1.p1  ORF type:complete len:360 (-),score=96.03 GEMP01002038.1:3771-4850(-)
MSEVEVESAHPPVTETQESKPVETEESKPVDVEKTGEEETETSTQKEKSTKSRSPKDKDKVTSPKAKPKGKAKTKKEQTDDEGSKSPQAKAKGKGKGAKKQDPQQKKGGKGQKGQNQNQKGQGKGTKGDFSKSGKKQEQGAKGKGKNAIETGTCKWFDPQKGFGFILPDHGGDEVFVHHTEINANGFKSLQEGELVQYNSFLEDGDPTRRKARNVSGPGGKPVKGDQSKGGGFFGDKGGFKGDQKGYQGKGMNYSQKGLSPSYLQNSTARAAYQKRDTDADAGYGQAGETAGGMSMGARTSANIYNPYGAFGVPNPYVMQYMMAAQAHAAWSNANWYNGSGSNGASNTNPALGGQPSWY